MSVKELQETIIKKIKKEKDEGVLAGVHNLLQRDFEVSDTGVVYLTEEQKLGVQKGLDDVAAGRILSHKKVMKEMKALLKKLDEKH